MSENKKFLGIGWKFPINIDSQGLVMSSEYEENIKESIRIILETAKGERVMRPNFGCGIHEFAFEVINASTIGQMKQSIRDALKKWEPRIELLDVKVDTDNINSGKLIFTIEYLVSRTNNQFNLVYPFYLTEGIGS
ncbi:MAG: GPW/gp25 family protein [Nitrosopumilus sp.]|nr:GPW/gp25 family protein [Nitrosopumilus sp.]